MSTKSEYQSVVIQVIIALIASSFIVTVFTTVYADFLKKPYIISQVTSLSPSKYSVDISNRGLEPATNLTVTIKSIDPFDPKTVTIFSTHQMEIIENTSKLFSFYIPKFMHGPGEVINLEFDRKENVKDANVDDIIVFSSYDQGSNVSEAPTIRSFLIDTDVLHFTILFVIVFVIYVIIVWKLIGRTRKRSQTRRTLEMVEALDEIIDFIGNEENVEEPYDKWYSIPLIRPVGKTDWAKTVISSVKSMDDYRKITSILKLLKERDNLIKDIRRSRLGPEYIRKTNKDKVEAHTNKLLLLNEKIKEQAKEAAKISWNIEFP